MNGIHLALIFALTFGLVWISESEIMELRVRKTRERRAK